MNNKTIEKYDGKAVEIEGLPYRIDVITTNAEISVHLHPLSGGDIAYSKTNTDNYQYTHGGRIYKRAVLKAKGIKREVEEGIEPNIKK